jgi:hypothetical protein
MWSFAASGILSFGKYDRRVLETLTVSDFAPAVGELFLLEHEQAGRLELELLEASTIDSDAPATDPEGRRMPFRLLFRGPTEPTLPQRIYGLEHGTVGRLEIFIVPVARDEQGVHYEAIFA